MDQTTKARVPPGPTARPVPAHPDHQSGNSPHQRTGHHHPDPHHAASTT
ncbi:hypothetical protein ACH4ZX_33535 [Streptomyces sp. NPDC020490]